MLKAVSSVALVVVLGALVALASTGSLFSASPAVIALQVVAVALAGWARRAFPRGAFSAVAAPVGQAVIRRGPYRLIRHPMYAAALLLVGSAAVGHLGWWTATIGALAAGVVVVRIVVEERLLRARYVEYAGYARTTKALIPYVV